MGLLVSLASSSLLLLLLLLTLVPSFDSAPLSSCSSGTEDELRHLNSSGLHLILHHPMHPCSPTPLPSSSSSAITFSAVLAGDEARVRSLAARLTGTQHRPGSDSLSLLQRRTSTVSIPLSSGGAIGLGNYMTRVGLGTPAKSYAMVFDTGSSLTWLQCSPCRVSCHEQAGPIFDPAASATYRTVPCAAAECDGLESATLNPSECSRSNVCVYQVSYGDRSFSVGYLSRDTLSIGSQSVPGFVYGCGQDNEGLFGRAAGLIGLSRSNLSLLSQLAPKFGNSFSYCLPTKSSTGYLSIGSDNAGQYTYTPMVSSSMDKSLYSVALTKVTVAGRALPVGASAYASMPTIIDTGTVISRLPPDVYNALSNAVTVALRGHARAPAYSILDTCFAGSLKDLPVPTVEMAFGGGATLRLAPGNVMIDVKGSVTCLAFASAGMVAIVGNVQQQTFRVAYDVANSRIGFGAGGCN